MKAKTIFLILFGIWFLDFTSTVIALNLFTGIGETNPLAKYFFNLGFLGYLTYFLITVSTIFIYSKFLKYCYELEKNKLKTFTLILGISIIFISELFCVINNIKILLDYI